MTLRTSSQRTEAMPDGRIVEMVRDGHHRAFEVLVQRYSEELTRYCRRMGLSESRAEDVLQHALLRAWMAIEAGTEVRQLRPWLYRIVHNTAVNAMRSSPDILSPLEEAESMDATAAGADFERRLAVRSALSSVAALPAMQREAILMSAVDGRSHEEVATALGVTDGAVRGLLYRARATLRAAAAALTPAPLIGWAGARFAPVASRVTEMTAQGGTAELGGSLFKGAAVAVTAAVLVAGATQVPFHPHHSRHHAQRATASAAVAPSAMRSAAPAAAGAPRPSGPSPTTRTLALAQGGRQLGQGQGSSTAGRGRSGQETPTRTGAGPAPDGGSPAGVTPLIAAASPGLGASRAAGGLGGAGNSPDPGRVPAGGEAPGEKSGSAGSKSGGEGKTGSEGRAGGEGTTERERAAKEREAEQARELKEREAEAAREAKEREAEQARELKEREAEASKAASERDS